MSDRVGDRLLIGILVLIASFAVFVTASGHSGPPRHTHCNPFDLDCDPDATFTPTATPTPVEVWEPWTDTGNTDGKCAARRKEQSRTSNLGNTQTRSVSDAYGDETWGDTWTDTGEERGSGANLEKEQSRTSTCSRTQTRWVPKEVWGAWTDTGNFDGKCAARRKEQSRTSNLGNTQTEWVSDAYGDETWGDTWTDTGEERGSGANLEKEQSRTSTCSRTQTRWVPKEVWGPWTDTGNFDGKCAARRKEQSRTSNLGNTQTRSVSDAYGDETWGNTWTDTGEERGSGANLEKEQSRTSTCSRTQTRWVPKEVWGAWTDTGNFNGTCAARRKEQSRTSNLGNTQTEWVSDAYGDETWGNTWTDTGNTRGSGADLEKEQSRTSTCSRTQTRWVPKEVWGAWTDTGNFNGTCAARQKEQSRTSNLGNTQTRSVSDAYGDETWGNTWTDTGNTRGSGANREKEQSRTSTCGRTQTRWVDDPEGPPPTLSAPTWSSAPSYKSYRWFTIDWGGSALYTDFEIQWREQHTVVWFILDQSGTSTSGPRALLTGTFANVRGIPYNTGGTVEFQVIGIAENGRRSPPSDVATLARQRRPKVSGHQHDHRVAYDISGLGQDSVGRLTWLAARAAAQAWETAFPTVGFCIHRCASSVNTDGKVITVENGYSVGALYDGTFGNDSCGASVACLKNAPRGRTIETHIGDRPLVIEEPGFWGAGRDDDPYIKVRWTFDRSLSGQLTGEAHNEEWQWITRVMVHEFGHALGLPDNPEAPYVSGIMVGTQTISSDDTTLLGTIYEGHTRGEGW